MEVGAIAEKLRGIPSVESVETYQRWTDRVSRSCVGASRRARVLALVVFAAVISVIGSTMRLALHRRRIEVEVLKLVGATDRFVRRPFLVEGAVQGALGAARRSACSACSTWSFAGGSTTSSVCSSA